MFGTHFEDIQNSTCTHLNFEVCGGLEEPTMCSDCSIKTRTDVCYCSHPNTKQNQEGITICTDCKFVVCAHSNVVEDLREGSTVCTECALVVNKHFYLPQTFKHENLYLKNSKKDNNAVDFLKDVCENVHIPNNVCRYALGRMKKIMFQTKSGNYKINELASYSLYDALNHFDAPRTPEEVSNFTGVSSKTLWKIEKNMRNSYVIGSDATLYVDRLCAEMSELSFHDKQLIKDKIRKLNGVENIRPTCLVAAIAHLHCKNQKYIITLKSICEMCNVSSSNVHKVIRKIVCNYA